MTGLTDEILMAYADGELGDAEHRQIAAQITDDAQAQATVRMFRETAALARQALEAPAGARDLSALEARIRALPFPSTAEPTAPVASLAKPVEAAILPFENTRARRHLLSRAVIQRIAAAIILSVAVASGWMLGRVDNGERDGAVLAVGTVPKDAPVARLLESQQSGMPVGSLVVVATLRDGRGRPCREFELLEQGRVERPVAAAIACRQADGQWSVEGAARIAVQETTAPGFTPSGTEETDAMATLARMLGARPVMSAQEEKDWIRSGWK